MSEKQPKKPDIFALFEYSNLFSWVRPSAGCVGFVRYHNPEPIDDFCQRLVETAGVLLLPASVYDVPSNHFRIGFGRANMLEALEKLESFVITPLSSLL